MPDTVFLDGEFLDPSRARVSALDAGFQHAVGLFETMHAIATEDGPRVFRLWQHLERLAESASTLRLAESLEIGALGEAVVETVRRAEFDAARVRLTVTGGDLNLLRDPQASARPTVMIHAQRATAYPDEMFERGVVVRVGDLRVNPFDPHAGHKTLDYWSRLRELQAAGAKGTAESLIFQVTNHLAGGAVSNAFVVKDGVLRTPIARGEEKEVAEHAQPRVRTGQESSAAMPSPVLPGVTRRFVLSAARELGLETDRRMLTIDDVLGADEVFLTNSSWGVLPVIAMERERIGDAEPGGVTRKLRRAWLEAQTAEPEARPPESPDPFDGLIGD
jgi:branched-chain amino acid aminotransferase